MAEIVDFGLQKHKIKMDSWYFENVLSVVAGDTGRRIEVQLLDNNGMVQDTTGLNLRLNAIIAEKSTFTDATLVDATTGKYRLDLSNGMFLAPGKWQFQWQIIDATGKKLHSFVFTGNVGENISEGGTEATNFYFNLNELQELVKDLNNIPPERTSFLEVGGFSKVTIDLYKSITLSPQGDFYITDNGQMANTAATQPYKNTGKITIIAGAEYKTKGVNTWLFYDTNNAYLGYWEYTKSGAPDASTLQDLPIRANASYMIGNVNNLYWKVSPVTTPEILQITDSADAISFPKLVVEPSNFSDGTKDFINGTGNGISNKYKGEIVVNLGDSLIENKNPSISEFIATDLGANVINGGFGGCMMSPHPNAQYAKFSMTSIADAIATGVWTSQEGATGVPSSYAATVAILKSTNWSDVDIITISYGTNDWLNSNLLDDATNKFNKATYLGALRYSVKTILQKYPHIKILVTTPIFRSTNDRTENSDNWKNGNTVYMKDFADALILAGKEIKIPIADTFYGLGINAWNESYYFPSTDGTHPNAFGRELLAQKIANEIRRVY